MLVPLETLFGWPSAPDPTPLQALGLLVAAPLVVYVIAFAWAKAHQMLKVSKVGPGPQPSDPIWMGGQAKSIMDGPEVENKQIADSQRNQI